MATNTHASQFRSNSDEIKHYAKEIMEDGKPHLRKDLIEKIIKKTGNTSYTDGQWAGSFQAILKLDGYTSPKAGVYQYTGNVAAQQASTISGNEHSIFQECQDVIGASIEELKTKINATDLMGKNSLELTAEEFDQVKKLRNLIQQLEEIKSNLI